MLVTLVSACAHTSGVGPDGGDPYESFNRAIFGFNDQVDRAVLEPAARGYKKVVPARARKSVGNFFANLLEPITIVNDVLQGKLRQAAHDSMRFVINSTFGLAGLLDLATPLGLERHEEDFGQTFSVWGLGRGPYLVLPFLGPSTVVDSAGLIPRYVYTDLRIASSTEETVALIGTNAVDSRARLLGASKVSELQLDPYIFRREAYLQRRLGLIHDGAPPLEDDWE